MTASPLRLVVCINDRMSTKQRSCVGSGNLDHIAKIKTMMANEGLTIPIVERECLGRCAFGPIMRIAPDGNLFTEIDDSVLDEIITELKRLSAEAFTIS